MNNTLFLSKNFCFIILDVFLWKIIIQGILKVARKIYIPSSCFKTIDIYKDFLEEKPVYQKIWIMLPKTKQQKNEIRN